MKTKFNGILTLLLAFVVQITFAQEKKVSGTVSDSSGPLPGVNIIVEGTTHGTETDFDGNYTLKTKKGDVLVFSFVGMETVKKTVGSSKRINVVMKASKDNVLDEVVVTAYGTQKKSAVSGSIKTIKSTELEKTSSANVVQSLSGKAAGIQVKTTSGAPGASAEVRFRGIGSLSASNSPLYVVNGVPFSGDISSIPSQDIASITFLKDASATALYGSRGANGVIVVTTKKGKNGEIKVNYQSKVGISTRAIKDYDKITNPKEYLELETQRIKLGQMVDGKTETEALKYASDNLISSLGGYNPYNVPAAKLIDPMTGKVNPNAKLLYSDDWDDAIFHTAMKQEHFLGMTYGNDKVNTYLSLGYLDDQGYVKSSGYKRVTARANINYSVSEKVKLGLNLNYANTDIKRAQIGNSGNYSNLFSWTRNLAPIFPIWARDKDGNKIFNQKGEPIYDFGNGEHMNSDGQKTNREYVNNMNPYATNLKNIDTYKSNSLNGLAYVSFDFWNGFNFKYNLGYELNVGKTVNYGWEENGNYKKNNGMIYNDMALETTMTNQQLLSWKKTFGDHNVELLVGHESSNYKSENIEGQKYNIVISGDAHFSNASKMDYLAGFNTPYQIEGYLSKGAYNYKNKYFVNASFRRDASSVFHPDYRWGNFYGFGAAWNVAKESFLADNKVINNLKLKASYGEQGNDYIYYPGYVSGNYTYRNYKPYMNQYRIDKDANGDPTIKQIYTGTKDLKWEVSKNFNAGLELSLYNRVNIEASYFVRKVADMLYNFPQQPSSGIPNITKNIADMENKGFEVSFDADIIKKDNVKLNLWANATHYKNTITALPEPFTSGIFRFVEGKSAYTYYMREFVGVDKETGSGIWHKGGDIDKNGVAKTKKEEVKDFNDADKYLLDKTANPDVYGGFGLNFEYNNWSLSSNFAYQFGGYVFDSVYSNFFVESTGMGNSGHNLHKDAHKTWNTNNKEASLPRLTTKGDNQYGTSDFFLIKGDYISLENITLSYNLGKKYLGNSGFDAVTFSVAGNNLWLMSKRQGFDPRTSRLGSQTASNGSTGNTYSALKSLTFGVNVKF